MISPSAIDHLCLVVTSLSRAHEYYRQLFEFRFTPRDGDPHTLVAESAQVHFFITEVPDAPLDFVRLQHISFRVGDLEAVKSRLTAAGITDYRTGQVDFFTRNNYRWCEWRDPDGIRLECVQAIESTRPA